MRDDTLRLNEYLNEHCICEITIISPHLDDAAFSLSTFITQKGLPPIDVVTIYTENDVECETDWSSRSGFTNSVDEFSHRKLEDIEAMKLLGVPYNHAGYSVKSFDLSEAHQLAQTLFEDKSEEQILVLLPIGAGGTVSRFENLIRWLIRKPTGCPPHADHELVRDLMILSLNRSTVRVGYYAEIPYQWANSPQLLLNSIINKTEKEHITFSYKPNLTHKLEIIRSYKSQYRAEFGDKLSYQERVASISEKLYLPVL